MNQKKNKKLIIITSILVVVLIILAGGTYAYFGTDLLKSKKELFFKYLTQIGDNNNGFVESSLKNYFDKKSSNSYFNQGSLSVNVNSSSEQSQYENTNKMKLTFDGQVDNTTNYLQQNISLNYSDNVNFPIIFKKIGNKAGIQTDNIGSKFITIDLDSDNSSINGMDELEKVQDLVTSPFSEEELNKTFSKYVQILNSQLQDSSFSKIEENSSKGYKLSLTGEELKNITIKLLETLKNDQVTLEKINEYLKKQRNSLKLTVSDIDSQIEKIKNDNSIDEKNVEISVFQNQSKTNRVSIKIDDFEAKIEKILTGNDLQYILNLQGIINGERQKGEIIAKFQGLQGLLSITENYEVILDTKDAQYKYSFNNVIDFSEEINRTESFNDENSLNLSELEKEQRSTFIGAVIKRIQKLNKKQMEKLGLDENSNPLQYAVPHTGIYSEAYESINSGSMSEEEVATYNQKFELYASTNLKGVTVKGLLTTIGLNNETQEYEDRKIKEIHFDGEEYEASSQNITIIKSNVELETAYRVEFEKDENTGAIYRAVINKK